MYLIPNDYNRVVQDVTLSQIISGNSALQGLAEMTAEAEIASYLTQKFDIAQEFTNTAIYNPSATYQANNRVYLDGPAYLASSTYPINFLVLWTDGNIYQSNQAITVPEAWNPAHWTLLGPQYAIYYAQQPYPTFQLDNLYNVGDLVFWKNIVYKCLIATTQIDHDDLIQYPNTWSVSFPNVFPDDPVQGKQYWSSSGTTTTNANNPATRVPFYITIGTTAGAVNGGTTFSGTAMTPPLAGWQYSIFLTGYGPLVPNVDITFNIVAGSFTLVNGTTFVTGQKYALFFEPLNSPVVITQTLGTYAVPPGSLLNANYFTYGDNRNQQMVVYTLDCVIYHIYKRINPQVIPALRIDNYDRVIMWLRNVAKNDDVQPNLIKVQPPMGARIRLGSSIKLQNNY